jgi:hypothetical protein
MIDKWIHAGLIKDIGDVYIHIRFDGERLSMSGVEGPLPNGNCKGSCGQINLKNITTPVNVFLFKIAEIWERYHLNDMRPYCEHQKEMGWHKLPIDESKPLNTYGKHFPNQQYDSWNMLGWVTRKEHPKGLLSEPCPKCGYKYGTSWLKEKIPSHVISFLESLPGCEAPKGWR